MSIEPTAVRPEPPVVPVDARRLPIVRPAAVCTPVSGVPLQLTAAERRPALADEIRGAAAAGEHSRVGELVGSRPLEAWYELPPHELQAVLLHVPERTRRRFPSIGAVGDVLTGVLRAPGATVGAVAGAGSPGTELRDRLVAHIGLRMRGAPRAALARFSGLGGGGRSASPLYDSTDGLEALVAVQVGTTRWLAGDLHGAIAEFTRAQRNPPVRMPHLHRDAYVKPALVHAHLGDPVRARALLDEAARLPRGTSWVEEQIDTQAELAEILLLPPGDEPVERVQALPLRSLGDVWPIYVGGLWMIHRNARRRVEGIARVAQLRDVWPVAPDGDGFPKSVVPLSFAEYAILDGDIPRAERHLAQADPSFGLTAFVGAILDRSRGRRTRAINTLNALAPVARGMRFSDFQRRIVLATILAEDGDDEGARAAIRALTEDYGPLREYEAAIIPDGLVDSVTASLAGQPARELAIRTVDAIREPLTSRERDVLTALASHPSRTAAAASLYISLNTFKTHQRSLYRKLGVSTRTAAIAEGSRRGLV